MGKRKTHKGTQKRVKITATGKVMHGRCGARKLMSHKSSKRKRRLAKATIVSGAQGRTLRRLVAGY